MLASYHLEGEANNWWQWFERTNRDNQISLRQFEKGILVRFGHGDYEDPNESICKLKQRGGFSEFLSEFERLANCLPEWSEEALLGAFMAGLNEEIAGEIRLFKPKDLQSAIELAKRKEEQIHAGKRWEEASHAVVKSTTAPTNSNLNTRGTTSGGARRLSWEEMQLRREKNICFNCDEKFTPGHRCKVAQALLIEFDESDDGTMKIKDEESQVFLNTISGLDVTESIRLTGEIKGSQVEALIDSGASLNFINPSVASKLQLTAEKVNSIPVRIANGEKLECTEKYKSVAMRLQGYDFTMAMYALPIVGVDVILGLPWLKHLGPVWTDYNSLTMKFQAQNGDFTIKGRAAKEIESVDTNNLMDWEGSNFPP